MTFAGTDKSLGANTTGCWLALVVKFARRNSDWATLTRVAQTFAWQGFLPLLWQIGKYPRRLGLCLGLDAQSEHIPNAQHISLPQCSSHERHLDRTQFVQKFREPPVRWIPFLTNEWQEPRMAKLRDCFLVARESPSTNVLSITMDSPRYSL